MIAALLYVHVVVVVGIHDPISISVHKVRHDTRLLTTVLRGDN